ncbi:melanization protease 1-like [Chironomus tepperi]|uniref:melanization protease 1-like n=1 Tax=Chironomus tepperi TaxID=113505 RepID=UPI00391F4630
MGNPNVYLLLFAVLALSVAAQSDFAACTNGQTCQPQHDCPDIMRRTSKGYLTPDEKQYLKSKHCNKINRLNYFCCGGSTTKSSEKLLPEPPTCGISLADRIVGGKDTNIDDYPWIAQIYYSRPGRSTARLCCGSLISERWVLTAAHCDREIKEVHNYDIISVRLGDWDTRTDPDCQELINEHVCNDPYVDVPVAKIISHEDYDLNSINHYNDIALLKLQRNVKFTKWIYPICLPFASDSATSDYTGQNLEVAGYGRTETETSSPVKQRLDLDGVKTSQCQQYYNTRRIKLADSQLCAGGEKDKDSCNGDSGGPLMKYGTFPNAVTPYYMLVGVVSFGPTNCGTKDAPGVYTRVTEYMDWIEDKIRNS